MIRYRQKTVSRLMRQFGTLRHLPSGRWQARYVHPHTGERLGAVVTFERKSDAARWLSTVEADIARGKWIDSSAGRRVTVAEWAERWLASDPGKRSSTLARDRQALDHFLPDLGRKALNAVTPGDVQVIASRLSASQAPATVRRNFATFTSVMGVLRHADRLASTATSGAGRISTIHGTVHWGRNERWLAAAGAAVFILLVAIFLWVWIGMWSLPPGRYSGAATWWTDFVLPRAAEALLVAVPLAALIGWLTNHVVSSRWSE